MQLHASRRPTRLSACRQCLQAWLPVRAALSTSTPANARPRARPRLSSASLLSTPSVSRRHASYQLGFGGNVPAPPSEASAPRRRPIRQYLRDIQDDETNFTASAPLPRDAARAGATENAMTRVESYDLATLVTEGSAIDGGSDDDPDAMKLWQTNHDSVDPSAPESLFARPYGAVSPKAGDLIEVSTDSWRIQMLAVCLGNFRGVDHYYTNTGKWFASTNVHTMFHVTNFATLAELQPTIAALPSLAREGDEGAQGNDTSVFGIDKMLNTLQDMRQGPTREAAAGLLKKMQVFLHQSQSIHMAYASLLDNAYSIIRKAIYPPPAPRYLHATTPVPVCWTQPFTKEESLKLYKQAYFSIDELASILFRHQQSAFAGPQSSRLNHRNVHALRHYVDKANGGGLAPDEFTAPAMYAIYRAIVADDVAFRPVSSRLGNPNEIDDAADAMEVDPEAVLPNRTRSCLFQVSPPEDVDMVNEVEELVREFNAESDNIPDNGQARDLGDTRHRLAAFIMNARVAIDHSRKTRHWSPYGMLLPIPEKNNEAWPKRSSESAKERLLAYRNMFKTKGPHQTFKNQKMLLAQETVATRHSLQRKMWNNQDMDADGYPHSPAYSPLVRDWYPYDIMVLHFMHLWAGYRRFSSTSRLHWIGSSILRATQRYEDSEYLTMSTGWTFLQEVGYIKPWDIPARYSMSLPDVPPQRGGTLNRTSRLTETFEKDPAEVYKAHDPEDLLAEDIFEGRRQVYNAPTYCIDSADTEDVDDGISIQKKGPNFLVRIHIADPASRIRPGSTLAEMAKQMPQTSYLPGFTSPMFPEEIVRKKFSLAPERPCLTFSVLLSKTGKVLDSQIRPGVLGKVIYLTPEDASEIVSGEEARVCKELGVPPVAQPRPIDLPWRMASFAVGTPHTQEDVNRLKSNHGHLTNPDSISYRTRTDLRDLMMIATILRQARLKKGAMPLYWPRPQVKVHMTYTDVTKSQSLIPSQDYMAVGSLPDSIATWKGGRSTTFYRCEGDPHIQVYFDGHDDYRIQPHMVQLQGKGCGRVTGAASRMVESIMRLAGETAANWCAERNIAIPYRGQPAAIPHLERLEVLARTVIYPELLEGKRPPEDALVEFRRLLGSDEITAVPVPHVTMGAKRYTKATSPLRRYSDLVVHWQIESVLRAEMNKISKDIGSTIVPSELDVDADEDADADDSVEPDSDTASGTASDTAPGATPGTASGVVSGAVFGARDEDSLRKAEKKREEQRRKDRAIAGAVFSRDDLERDILPLMRVRERQMRTLDNRMGTDQWMLQALVRAWKGGELVEVVERPVFNDDRLSKRRIRKTIKREEKHLRKELGLKTKKLITPDVPLQLQRVGFRNLRFLVTAVNTRQGIITGRLDWFERVALMEIGGLNPRANEHDADALESGTQYYDDTLHAKPDTKNMQRLALEDVQVGDVFPVALDFVDVHANRVIVRRTGDAADMTPPPPPVPLTKADKMRKKRALAKVKAAEKVEKDARTKERIAKVRARKAEEAGQAGQAEQATTTTPRERELQKFERDHQNLGTVERNPDFDMAPSPEPMHKDRVTASKKVYSEKEPRDDADGI